VGEAPPVAVAFSSSLLLLPWLLKLLLESLSPPS
jgi:hypothetical protein